MKTIVNLYNAKPWFHSPVQALFMVLVAFTITYQGGIPSTKAAVLSLLAGAGSSLWAAFTRWLQSNVASKSVPIVTPSGDKVHVSDGSLVTISKG